MLAHASHTCYMHCIITLLHSSGFFIIMSPAEGLHFSALAPRFLESTLLSINIHSQMCDVKQRLA